MSREHDLKEMLKLLIKAYEQPTFLLLPVMDAAERLLIKIDNEYQPPLSFRESLERHGVEMELVYNHDDECFWPKLKFSMLIDKEVVDITEAIEKGFSQDKLDELIEELEFIKKQMLKAKNEDYQLEQV